MRIFCLCGLFGVCSAVCLLADGAKSEREISYDREVRPILSENCFACHGFDAEAREADLRLDIRQDAIDNGAIDPDSPASSTLIARIESTNADELMPPHDSGRSLTAPQKQILKQWIEQGAKYESHWAFTAPVAIDRPQVDGVDHSIDRFIQDRLKSEQFSPSPIADAQTLARRLYLDLIGLPPTMEQLDDFVRTANANNPVGYEELVDRLLASPHYGERWGRWWLDQARYADSNGYSIDGPREIWLFRDWVVQSLNADMPFDQFTIEQLAGDLLPGATESQRIATGFHRNTQINQEGGIDPEQFRIDSIFDRVATTGTVWLGLTVGCAQCHDHKFDPVTQKEFYQLFAFLNNQDEPTLQFLPPDVDGVALRSELAVIEAMIDKLFEQSKQSVAKWEKGVSEGERKKLGKNVTEALSVPADKQTSAQKLLLLNESKLITEQEFPATVATRYTAIRKQLDRSLKTMVLAERKKPRKTTVFIKGDFTRPDIEVTPGTPAVLHPFVSETDQTVAAKPNRLDLAHWIVDPANPMTARVIVNRVWQQYFGRGLVETDNDFGLQGTSPSHPELLDWLAVNFREQGWSIKRLHRLIVTSHTYRQSSNQRSELRERDPLNVLLARQNRLRLDAEIVRDVSLHASGMLAAKLGGPPVYPPIPDGVMGQGQIKHEWKVSQGTDRYRRGLYTFVYRATPPPSLNVFDAPEGLSSCTRRLRSNTPLQALTLMNDSAFVEFARSLEEIIKRDGLVVAFRRCTARTPTDDELKLLGQLGSFGAARALLNLDETITRE